MTGVASCKPLDGFGLSDSLELNSLQGLILGMSSLQNIQRTRMHFLFPGNSAEAAGDKMDISPLEPSSSEHSKREDKTTPGLEHVAPPAAEKEIAPNSPPPFETRTPESPQRDATT